MKSSTLSLVVFVLIGFSLSCQDSKIEEAVPKVNRSAGARRACSNQVNYGFLKPDTDFDYGGDGCQDHYVHRGSTRTVKVKMANTSSVAQYIAIQFEHPNNTGHILYSVASVTGGSTSSGSPIPGTLYGGYIFWDATVPAFTTYEMTLNVTGVTGSTAAENGVRLTLLSPCAPGNSNDCDQDDNMHFVLTN